MDKVNVSEAVSNFELSLAASTVRREPYRHWLLKSPVPDESARAIGRLPFEPAMISDTKGRRETSNASRVFFNEENRARFPICEQMAQVFQNPTAIRAIERGCNVRLKDSNLRIEYCQDTGDFWLEPHTDIAEKRFTMLVYLSDEPEAESWGTDIYDAAMNHLGSAPGGFNKGLIFIPGKDTWHGFRQRPIAGVRRSIIVNYVSNAWRARHELSFPSIPVGRR